MLFTTSLASLALMAHHEQTPVLQGQLTGIFSNEEQVYFAKDAGETAPPAMSLAIEKTEDGLILTEVDAYGTETATAQPVSISMGKDRDIVTVGNCSRFFERENNVWSYSQIQNRKLCRQKYQIVKISTDALTLRLADGSETILKRARPVTCWAAIPKKTKKEDGSTDWHFARQLKMHDQGGRVRVGGKDTGAEEIILRMRAVHWPPPSTNRPSMVLYIHKPDDPNRAVSYSWADIDASRVGINLRWMQASCTISGAKRTSGASS